MQTILRGILALGLTHSLVMGVRADDRADAMSLINQALEAAGGADKLAKAKGQIWREEGTYYGMGDGVPFTSSCAVQFPNRFKMEIEGFFLIVLDGEMGWMKANGETSELKGEELKEHLESQYSGWVASLVPLADKAFQLKPLGESKVDDQLVKGVLVSRDGHRDVKLYFGDKSGLLVKSEFEVLETEQGGKKVSQEVFYDDHQEVDGLRLPRKITIKHDGKKFVEAKVSELKTAEMLDDEIFAKP